MMNNVYSQRDLYSSRNQMCFDNKGMVSPTPTPSDRTSTHAVHVNITDVDKEDNVKPSCRFRRNIRLPQTINGLVAVTVILLILLIEYGIMPGKKLGYTCQDPSISYKYKGEMITPAMLIIGCLLIPFALLVCTELLIKEEWKKLNMQNIVFLYREFFVGASLVLLLTEIAKVLVGEHRPHFFDVCEPDTAANCVPGTYVEDYTCTSNRFSAYFIVDSSRSFPSGHSSLSTFVGFFCGYVIHTRFPTKRTGIFFKPFLIAVCLTWSLVCSLSRITDRRHHWWDVLMGMMIGAIGALYAAKIIRSKICTMDDMPTPMISRSTTTLLDVKNKDATSVII